MTTKLRIQLFVVVLVAALAAFIVAPIPNKPKFLSGFRIQPGIDLAGGAELRYKVLFRPDFQGDRAAVAREAGDVLRRRIDAMHLKEPKINVSGDDTIVVQLAGIDADGLRDAKKLIQTIGDLRLYAAAPPDLQSRFAGGHVLPAGYKIVENLLVEEHPVIEGRHIVHAEPRMTGDGRWVTEFELDAEGAKRFDEAAERLHRQVPRGRIAIVLDGKIRSAPVVDAPAFHGRGQITPKGK